ncbi:MAG: heme NO-binding domain-containing protein [Pseudomonadota bacterium]
MYGLVNKGIRDYALTNGGDAVWQRIRAKAEWAEDDFLSMQDYDDAVSVRLIGAAAEVLETTPDDIMRGFGRHWVLFTGQEGYGPLMSLSGATLPEFLKNLDAMHGRLKNSMMGLKPPKFTCTQLSDFTYEVSYFSEREGLAPMVEGLLGGLAERFDVAVAITCVEVSEAKNSAVFRLTL